MTSLRLHGKGGKIRLQRRGSALISVMILALVIAIGLASYLSLSRNSLRQAQRTYFFNSALNLAEAGLEKSLWCFSRLNAGIAPATAWSGWTLSGSDATTTLPSFNCGQNAIGAVKIFVHGFDGSVATPTILSQATITPFDGSAPLVRILQINITKGGFFTNGLVALGGMDWSGQPSADSFQSNPSNNPNGPFSAYPGAGAKSNILVIVPAGTVDLGSKGKIHGSLSIGPSVPAPPAKQVTGSITKNAKGTFKMPVYPSSGSVSQSYNLGSSIPSSLPRSGDLPASDGKYYYFASGATVGSTTIKSGNHVILVGTNTKIGSDLAIKSGASLIAYIDGTVSASGNDAINNDSWAGALQIFTTTTGTCSIGGNGQLYACLYAPYASLTCKGGGHSGMLIGSFVAKTISATGHMEFHYDETLMFAASKLWVNSSWHELQSAADRASVSSLTNNFLP